MKSIYCKLVLLVPLLFLTCGGNSEAPDEEKPQIHTEAPVLKGKLVYHNYTEYTTNDSEMWLYDFETNRLTSLSKDWNITNPMNAHFSPDGKQIVFMGIAGSGTWNVFLYDLQGGNLPVNLSAAGTDRDEDPKFSPDGKRIVLKRNSGIVEIEIATKKATALSSDDYSMPYYNYNGTQIVCSKGDGQTSSIAIINIATKEIRTLYDAPGVQDYYPIGVDEDSFYYSTGYSPNNRLDQVYRGFWSGLKSVRLPFNNTDGDYSDAYPVNGEWAVISSTRTGTRGGYDLYIANVFTGEVFSLSEYNNAINTPKNELGACVWIEEQ